MTPDNKSIDEIAREYAKSKWKTVHDGKPLIDSEKYKAFKAGYAAGSASKGQQGEGWISVKDGDLPEIGEYVLVIIGEDTILKGRLLYNGWTAFYADGEKRAGDLRPVSHWMQLPTPPLNEGRKPTG